MLRALYALRARVAYVVDGLLYHWQAEVVDASYQALVAAVKGAGDFEGVAAVHRWVGAWREGKGRGGYIYVCVCV